MYRIFFRHLKTTITHMDIYLSKRPMDRDSAFSMKELKDYVDKYQKAMKDAAPVKVTGKRKKNDDDDDDDDDRGEGSSQLPIVVHDNNIFLDPDAPLNPKEFLD